LHHPRRRAQPFDRKRETQEIVVRGWGVAARQIERDAHVVGEEQRLAVKRFDDRLADVRARPHRHAPLSHSRAGGQQKPTGYPILFRDCAAAEQFWCSR
jgi:hypothetical protein